MKLQLALDRLSWDRCFQLTEDVQESIDIIEIGTGVIKEYGMAIVREMRKRYPHHIILADMKICDAGKHEAAQAFEAGADIATVMAFAPQATIIETLETARSLQKEMMVDLLGVTEPQLVQELVQLGVTFVGLHLGKDQQKQQQIGSELFDLVEGLSVRTAVAGGVTLKSLPDIIAYQPNVIIVGSGLTKAEDPHTMAKQFKEEITRNV
ncbi:Fe-S cluster assembly protein HesB [Alkalicoccobacillus porphyridii]|uniref:3-hexulose-6-phosphate synthase n=2 Tax=Alkalicoccobacillus porphyridii TaxID=2597270 RepID=A0A554A2P6_9BACI|nr:Fe-S cluster assembly protein HesB [Alkalicoccobacillus porphyridii]